MSTPSTFVWRCAVLAACALFVSSCGGGDPAGPAPATPAAIAIVSGDSQRVTSGAVFGQPLVVKVTAASGVGVPGVTVTFQVTSGSGSVNPGSSLTDASGLAQTTVTAGATAGPLVITASVSTLTQTASAHLAVQPQPPATIAIVSGDSQSVTSGAAFGQPLVVKVTTASAAGVPGLTVTFQVTSGSGSVNPGSAVTDTSGRAQTAVTAGATAGPLVIMASIAALTQTASGHFTVQAPPTQFAGRWVGTTSQSRALTLWIGPAGVMDSLQVQISVPIPSGSCLVPFTPANIALGGSGSFSATLFSPTTQVSGTLSGTFPTATTASGTFQAGWSGGMICGSTIVFGGSGSSTGTWQATKSPMSVSSVSPNNGPLAGGTNVTIIGWFETSVDSVRVGTGRLGNLARVSSTRLTGTAPAGVAAGAVNVTAYAGMAASGTCTGCFTYNPVPTVSTVSPNSGPLAGGTAVTITGTNFPTTVDSVRVGTGRLGSVVRVSGTQLRGTTPAAGVAGTVDVVVYTTSAGNGSCTGCFTYNTVTVVSVSPTSGPLVGGTSVTITGTNFPTTVDSVRIGTGRLGNLVRVSDTQLTGTTAAGSAAGAVDVTVYTASIGTGTCFGCFTYNPAPTVSGVSPNSGPLAGGTAVTITGTNFPATVDSVRFGPGRLSSVVRVSGTQLTGITPAGSVLGAADVTVFSTSVGSGGCTGCFTYTPPVTWASLTAGSLHTCGLTSSGVAYCWGDNAYGWLGDGTTSNRTSPVAVLGGLVFQAISAGSQQTCGLTTGGAAYCWGYNYWGQLGDGTSGSGIYSTSPVAVSGGLVFQAISAGSVHTCGLTTGGAAYCWGSNYLGELGDGTTTDRTSPVAVSGGLVFKAIGAGSWHTCGLTTGGAAYCWGYNSDGRLGDGTTSNRTSPVAVAGGLVFQGISAGYEHTCGLTMGGAAYCWGYNSGGRLGDGTTSNRTSPVAVAGGLVFQAISAGSVHTCGLTSSGIAYCWGYNFYGQLGDSSTTQRNAPVAVAGGLTFASLTAGDNHTCGPASSGTAYCWGRNWYGQLGDGSTTERSMPVPVVSP